MSQDNSFVICISVNVLSYVNGRHKNLNVEAKEKQKKKKTKKHKNKPPLQVVFSPFFRYESESCVYSVAVGFGHSLL